VVLAVLILGISFTFIIVSMINHDVCHLLKSILTLLKTFEISLFYSFLVIYQSCVHCHTSFGASRRPSYRILPTVHYLHGNSFILSIYLFSHYAKNPSCCNTVTFFVGNSHESTESHFYVP